MITRYNSGFFETGPFASASMNVDVLSSNLYFSYLLEESLAQHLQSQEKFEKALLTNDIELMEQTKHHLDYLEGIFNLALTFTSHEELES